MFQFFNKFNKYHLIIFIILILVGLAIYANSLGNDVFWDDDDFLFNNVFVKEPAKYWTYYFTDNVIAGAGVISDYWRPLLLSVYSLEWHFWEQDFLPGYHFVSVLWHILNACLLFYFLSRLAGLFKKKSVAFLAALIFLIHPLQTEAVDYVSSLGDMLNVFFVLVGLIFYIKAEQYFHTFQPEADPPLAEKYESIIKLNLFKAWFFYSAAVFCYILGLLSKETAIIMLGLLILVEFYLWRAQNRQQNFLKFLKNASLKLLPFFSVALIYFILRATVLNFRSTFNLYADQINFYSQNFFWRLFTFFKALTIYLRLLLFPVGLHMERTADVADAYFDWSVIFGLIIFILSVWLAARCWKNKPHYTFAIAWFYIALAPVSGIIIPVNAPIYEHWLYLPMVGFWLLLIFAASDLQKKWNRARPALLLLLLIFLIFFSAQTIRQNRIWRDPITFYKNVIKYNDQQLRVWNNLGMEYADKKMLPQAIIAYLRAIALDTENISAPPHHNLAGTYKEQGRAADAEREYLRAIQIDKEFIYSYYGLVGLYVNSGRPERALEVMQTARQVFPKNKNIPKDIEMLKQAIK